MDMQVENVSNFMGKLPGYIQVLGFNQKYLDTDDRKILLIVKNCKKRMIAQFFQDLNEILDCADKAMYEAKKIGMIICFVPFLFTFF